MVLKIGKLKISFKRKKDKGKRMNLVTQWHGVFDPN